MIPKSLRKFMFELLDATEEKSISWKEGAGPDAYFCTHKNYNLHINYHFNEDEELGIYYFRIMRDNDDASFIVTNQEEDFSFMRNFSGSISVNASNFDNIVSDFFG